MSARGMQRQVPARLAVTAGVLGLIFAAGTVGYMVIEKWGVLDALFMTVITLTTVGYGETHPLSPSGRIFTMFLLLGGFGAVTYAVTAGVSFLMEGDLGAILRRKKMEQQIRDMKDHYIICAAGEAGDYAIEEFIKTTRAVVVVSTDSRLVEKLKRHHVLPILEGSPSDDETLLAAGIRQAKGLIAMLGNDKDNLFVVLSARGLNPAIKIVTQAIEESAGAKLKKAGADDVVLTDSIGGMRIASVMLRPTVVSFLDTMLRQPGETLRIEEAMVSSEAAVAGQTVAASDIAYATGVVIVAIREAATGIFRHSPIRDYVLMAGDVLIVIGTPEQIRALRALAESR